ncbi:MAG: M61 family metallopeptidase [Candidatus Acidiferrales bacterium]
MRAVTLARRALILSIAITALFAARPAVATIRYRVSLAHTSEHLFVVQMDIPGAHAGTEIAIPAWNALYQVRDFAYRVRDLHVLAPVAANGNGSMLQLRALDKQTWEIQNPASPSPTNDSAQLTVQYSIEWNDPGPFDSQLNDHHAFINFAEILMYLPDRRREDVEVVFDDVPSAWKIMAELPPGREPNSFIAESYDALVDAPAEAGNFSDFEFDCEGAHFRVIVDASGWNKSRLEEDLRRITAYELSLMGGPPFKEYTFFFHIGPYADVGGGGMEHSFSTAIAAASVDGAAAIAAHEFFHAWNVKRIRPRSLEPVDYAKEQHTRALWFAEGVTSTYAAFTLERSGLWSKAEFYEDLATQIGELESRPARAWQSVEESSLDAWLEKYDDYNRPDRSISYYNKGQIVGVMLDLAIRDATDNLKSLDDVLRLMNDEYAKAGKFYNGSEAIRGAVEEVSGKSFQDFFRRFVSGTDEIPYDDFLALAGLHLKVETTTTAELGFRPDALPGKGVTVSALDPDSAAAAAGLRDGDLISPLHRKSSPRKAAEWLRDRAPGDPVTLDVRRNGHHIEISFVVSSHADRHYSIVEVSAPTAKQRRIRNGLLQGATG